MRSLASFISATRTIFVLVGLGVLTLAQVTRSLSVSSTVFNSGVAFNLTPPPLVIYLVTIVMLVAITAWFFYTHRSSYLWAVGTALVVGGGLSNLIDRFRFSGQVADYIHIGNIGVVNLADIAITIGIILTLIHLNRDHA